MENCGALWNLVVSSGEQTEISLIGHAGNFNRSNNDSILLSFHLDDKLAPICVETSGHNDNGP